MLGAQVENDPPLVYLSFYVGEFYAGQESFLSRWKRRLSIAITALRGRDYEFEDIVLSPESAARLAEELMAASFLKEE